MDPRTAAPRVPDPEAVEFTRFCYRRRRVGWPELYDEMCAVAARGLFRGYDADDLASHGIGFALFDMPGLAVLASRIVEEEKALRRPMTVVITEADAVLDAAPHRVSESDFDVEVRPDREREPERVPERERVPEASREASVRHSAIPVPVGS